MPRMYTNISYSAFQFVLVRDIDCNYWHVQSGKMLSPTVPSTASLSPSPYASRMHTCTVHTCSMWLSVQKSPPTATALIYL